MDLITALTAAGGAAAGAAAADPYFNQTTLLLHGDGTNGAQNNTFLDSSTNNFTITRNGNTTQGTFSPFSVADGEWSNYFDGTSDNLSVANNAAFQFGTGDFTVEAWVYQTVQRAEPQVIVKCAADQTWNTGWALSLGTSNSVVSFWVNGSNVSSSGASTVTLNGWSHVAVSRSGTTLKMFINGVEVDSDTNSTSIVPTVALTVGADITSSTYEFQGYLSNVRVIKGTALYTGAFTPSTSPLTAVSGTSLLTCQSNRFVDNSTNNFAITVNGNPSVQPFSPFAPSAAYSPSVNGGSGYFDGSGDYLTTPVGEAAFGLDGDFTINYWLYLLSSAANERQISSGGYYTVGKNGNWYFGANTTNLYFQSYDGQASQLNVNVSITNNLNEWIYLSAVRSGSTLTLYKNGVSVASGTFTRNLVDGQVSGLQIGRLTTFGDTHGYIQGMEIVKGVATAPSGVPTAPATSTANTSLLLNFTNAGIFDNTGKNNLETVGNAQIDTTTKKYGTGSMEFDGTGDVLTMKETGGIFTFGTGDYTYECWIYTTTGATTQKTIFGRANTGNVAVPYIYLVNSTGVLSLYYSATVVSSTTAIAQNTWTHIAVCRASGTSRLFINGVLDGSAADTTSLISPDILTIGGSGVAAANPFIGYIDDVRITKGVARYTATFTPPDKAFPDL